MYGVKKIHCDVSLDTFLSNNLSMMTWFIGSVCVMTLLHWDVSLCGTCDVL